MGASLKKKIGIASLIMMASVMASRVIGIFRESVIAYIGGRGVAVDAYQVAFIIPDILNHIVASGFLSLTFIPIFSKYVAQNREAEGWRVFSIILNGFGLLLICLLVVCEWATPELIALAAPGWNDPAATAMVITMTRIILPAQFLFFSGGMFMAVQFAKEKFFLPALAPLIYNGGIILGGLLLGPQLGMVGFAWGVLAGAFLGNFALQYRGAKLLGMKWSITLKLWHPELVNYIKITLPLMFGLTMAFSHELFIRFFGSFLPAGSISGLNYANRVMQVLVGVFGQAVGAATYPFLSKMVAENNLHEANRLLNQTLRYLALIIPVAALVMVLRHEVVAILFERGKFHAADTAQTARMLMFMMPGAVGFAAQTLVVRGYYATQNTWFPTLFTTLAVLVSLPVYYLAMRAFGPVGIASAGAVSAMLQASLLFTLWNRRSDNREARQVPLFYGGMTLLAILTGIFLAWFKGAALAGLEATSFWGYILVCGATGMMFLAVLAGVGSLFRIAEIMEPLRAVVSKAKRIGRPV
ncbi:MAG: murein biosynthesis integral membrane protein MurJ [Desulfobacterales bacterium]|jgi:putative peptidoglycan lipid II flippase|nr:murein biosynthesis integral membrane protein MurJ [Desulfobacterales bacterium]